MKKIVLTGGGTAGHVTPNIALLPRLQEEGYEVHYIGSKEGMDSLMEDRTVFVIAHRLSTVRNSQAIMVLEQGQIIERGDHDDLIQQRGKYYQLYTGQAELS